MPELTNLSDIINRCTGGGNGNPQNIFVYKDARVGTAAATATVAGRMSSLWTYNGAPAGGATPPSTAEQPTSATAGSLLQVSPSAGMQQWLLGATGTSLSAGTLIVYDRLAHISGRSGTSATAQTINLSAARYTGSEAAGTVMWAEIYTLVGTTTVNLTASYTNENGTQGRTSQAVAFGGTGLREVTRLVPMALASGDRGVQSVESVTLSATTGTAGNWGVTLARPLLVMPLGVAGTGAVRDLIAGLPGIVEIKPNACLSLAWLANGTVSPQIFASLHMIDK
jgi:hypothetical protein